MKVDDLIIKCEMNMNNIAGKLAPLCIVFLFEFLFLGIYNTFLLAHYSKIDKRFPALARVLKHWGKEVEIIDSVTGYLNRFGFYILIFPFRLIIVLFSVTALFSC